MQQLKSGFKRRINWNKYQSTVTTQTQNQYSDYLIDQNFLGVNRLTVLSFEDNTHQTSYKQHFPPTAERKHLENSNLPVKEMIMQLVVY